jgi:hypothetical protein
MVSNNQIKDLNQLNTYALAAKKKTSPRACRNILSEIKNALDSVGETRLGRNFEVNSFKDGDRKKYDFSILTKGLKQRRQELKDDQYNLYTNYRTQKSPDGHGSWDGHIQKYKQQQQVLKKLISEFREDCRNYMNSLSEEERKALEELLNVAEGAANIPPPEKPDAVKERERRQQEGKEPNPKPGPAPSPNPNPSRGGGGYESGPDIFAPLRWIFPILFPAGDRVQSNPNQPVANNSTNTKPISNDVKEKLNVMYEKTKGISSDKTDLDIARTALKTGVDPKIVEIMITHSGKQTGSESVQKEYAAKIVQDAQKSQESDTTTTKANAVTSQMQLV